MSLGMSTTVAPLSTAVMGAVDQRHAGTASGINNAVSRTAGLLAIAVLGIVMSGVYQSNLTYRVQSLELSEQSRNAVLAQSTRLAEVNTGEQPAENQQAVRQAVEASFITAFRTVMLIAAGCGLISALFAFLLIDGKKHAAR
jgi:hypothetical protein